MRLRLAVVRLPGGERRGGVDGLRLGEVGAVVQVEEQGSGQAAEQAAAA
jgi:hypothetical protein